MSRLAKMSLSCKIILSSLVQRSREGSEVVQLCAVMIGRPLSWKRRRLNISYVLWEGVSCRVVVVCLGGLVFRSLLLPVVVSSLLT